MKLWLVLWVTAGLAFAAPAGAQSVSMDIATAHQVAQDAIAEENFELARALGLGLLQRDPKDYVALMSVAVAEASLGNPDQGAIYAGRAFGSAQSDTQKLAAARVAASSHFRAQQHSRAEIWLRRGANFARTEEETELVRKEYQIVRRQNPLLFRFSFSVAPSSNINDGSSERLFYYGGIPFVLSDDSLPLSGLEITGDAFLSYRISDSKTHITRVGLHLFARTYALSEDSKASAPDTSGKDYALNVAEVSLNHRQQIFDGWGATGVSAMLGKNWYAGDPLWQYYRLTLSQDFPVAETMIGNVRGFVENETALGASNSDTLVYDASASLGRRLFNNDFVRVSVGVRLNDADEETSDYTGLRAGVRYHFGQPVLDTRFSIFAGYGQRDYEVYSLSDNGRHDTTTSFGATAVFNGVSYSGFSPTLSLESRRTKSNISRFKTEQIFARLGIQSNF